MIREQFWRGNAERRGDQDEKRQPYQIMIAPSPHQRKPLLEQFPLGIHKNCEQ